MQVRILSRVPRARSSSGRAPHSRCGGGRFKSCRVHDAPLAQLGESAALSRQRSPVQVRYGAPQKGGRAV